MKVLFKKKKKKPLDALLHVFVLSVIKWNFDLVHTGHSGVQIV